MKLILLGPPGSGKGTMAQRLAEEFGYLHLSAGELLRQEIKAGGPIGQEIKKYVDAGKLVPPRLVVDMMKLAAGKKEDFIFDGFPRSLEQAEGISDLKIDAVVYLAVPDDVVIDRFAGRRTDPVTGKVYHIKNIPPPDDIKDRVIQRKDDVPEVIKQRLDIYHKETQPLIQFYKEKGLLKEVDGSGAADVVYAEVKKIIIL